MSVCSSDLACPRFPTGCPTSRVWGSGFRCFGITRSPEAPHAPRKEGSHSCEGMVFCRNPPISLRYYILEPSRIPTVLPIADSLHYPLPGDQKIPLYSTVWLNPPTQNPTPCTLHPTPYTLHPTPCILHPTPYTLNP